MIFHKQLFLHKPEEGQIGDCWRTCIGCLFNLPPDQVPHFVETSWNDPDATVALGKIREWLEPHDLSYVEHAFSFDSVEDALYYAKQVYKDLPVLFSGTSKNGTNHIVIAKEGEIIWDPAIDDSGIVGPASDGYYWFAFLAKRFS